MTRETWFCQSLGSPIPVALENPRQCPFRQCSFDSYGDHIQTFQRQSEVLPAHEWIVYLSFLLRSVGQRVNTHKVTFSPDNEHGDIEIRDYVLLPRGEANRIPPHTLLMEFTVTLVTGPPLITMTT